MRRLLELLLRIALLLLIWLIWLWVLDQKFSAILNLSIIFGGILLVFPLVWFCRKWLDQSPTKRRAEWITTFVHYSLGILFGVPICRALLTHQDWVGWILPIPVEIGWVLLVITGSITVLSVLNLALRGFGAPFAVALSRRLAIDWLYASTRNPMVLAVLSFALSMGIWWQSALFVIWVLLVFTPALLFFVKMFEERELEIRFGDSYLVYKAKTSFLIPGKRRT